MVRTSSKGRKQKQIKEIHDQQDNVVEERESTTDKENSETFEVEKIVHTRLFRGKRQFLIRWKGYGEESDTWEAESALERSAELLEEYKKENLGSDKANEEDSDDEPLEKKQNSPTKENKSISKKKNKKATDSEVSDAELDTASDTEQCASESNVAKSSNRKTPKKRTKESEKNTIKKNAKKPKTINESKKAKSEDTSNDPLTDGNDYEVDKILEVHFRRDGKREFLIRWKGYKPSDDTWEPEEHLDCEDLIEKFMERVKKAKSTPRRELREVLQPRKRFIPHAVKHIKNLRNAGLRPCYQE